MSKKRKRLYQLSYPGGGPAYVEDAGHLLKISGILMQGMGFDLLLLSPTAGKIDTLATIQPTLEEWCEILRRTDNPLVYEQDETGTIKAIHRKQEYAISGAIQQQIWARDGFRCMYCGQPMGKVQLTVDHFVPLELGGANQSDNLISACRRCNKHKGKIPPQEYCTKNRLDYLGLRAYLDKKASTHFINHLAI